MKAKQLKLIVITMLLFNIGLSYAQAQQCASNKTTLKKECINKSMTDAAWSNNIEAIKTFIEEKDISPDILLKDHLTTLHVAAYMGYTDMAKYMLSKGADPSIANVGGVSPLQTASNRGHIKVVKLLLQNGADIKQQDDNGSTVLHSACIQGQAEIAALLIKSGADVNALDNRKRPPLQLATWQGNVELIELLLDNGSITNYTTIDGIGPLNHLASSGNNDALRVMLNNGVDLNLIDDNGTTLIHLAVKHNHEHTVEMLLLNNINTNIAESTYGNTPLHIAAINGNSSITKQLLDNEANADIVNKSGKKPIDCAIYYGYLGVVQTYIDMGLAAEEELTATKQAKQSALVDVLNGEAVVNYTGHSGWIVQTQNNILVFDYWNQSENPDACLANGSFCPGEMKDKKVTVFVSHEHSDHFDTTIYTWAYNVAKINYVFGFRPEDSQVYKDKKYSGAAYRLVENNTTEAVNDIMVTTITSNEGGQGFLVEADGLSIYHPGDHALFTPADRESFVKEVDFIADRNDNVDIAFLPVTGCPVRWKKENIVEGFFYSIDKLNPKQVFPMHAFGREYLLEEFSVMAQERSVTNAISCVENKGDSFSITNSVQAKK